MNQLQVAGSRLTRHCTKSWIIAINCEPTLQLLYPWEVGILLSLFTLRHQFRCSNPKSFYRLLNQVQMKYENSLLLKICLHWNGTDMCFFNHVSWLDSYTTNKVEDDLVIGWCEKTPPICQPTYNDKEKTTIKIQQDTVTQSKGL